MLTYYSDQHVASKSTKGISAESSVKINRHVHKNTPPHKKTHMHTKFRGRTENIPPQKKYSTPVTQVLLKWWRVIKMISKTHDIIYQKMLYLKYVYFLNPSIKMLQNIYKLEFIIQYNLRNQYPSFINASLKVCHKYEVQILLSK